MRKLEEIAQVIACFSKSLLGIPINLHVMRDVW